MYSTFHSTEPRRHYGIDPLLLSFSFTSFPFSSSPSLSSFALCSHSDPFVHSSSFSSPFSFVSFFQPFVFPHLHSFRQASAGETVAEKSPTWLSSPSQATVLRLPYLIFPQPFFRYLYRTLFRLGPVHQFAFRSALVFSGPERFHIRQSMTRQEIVPLASKNRSLSIDEPQVERPLIPISFVIRDLAQAL